MKTLRVRLGIVAALLGGTVVSQAHGCGFPFVPFWSFGLGWGLGAATAMATAQPYPVYPVYTSPRPDWSYRAEEAPAASQQTAPVQEAAPEPPPSALWFPSTPGAGHWVPDPTPYSYTPATVEHVKPESEPAPTTVSTSSFPGNVRVYVVTQ